MLSREETYLRPNHIRARQNSRLEKKTAVISHAFEFKDFPAAVKFVDAVAGLAEQAWHHPDIDIRWNKVTLTLTTHDAGGLTQKDFDLARHFDQLSLR
jgi:4a-hydroxytetrahydrobiopterin dehydratase